MATITDFDGVIAAAEIQGTAQGTDGSPFRVYNDVRRGVIYTSDRSGQTTVSAGVGVERNGVVFQ
jgi:hypothetical protein